MDDYQDNKTNLASTFIFEILLIYHFEIFWACSAMLDYPHIKYLDQFIVSRMSIHKQKMNFVTELILAILLVYHFAVLSTSLGMLDHT